jgi:hypothetical protein
LGAEELVSLGAHARVIHSRQSAVPRYQFLGAEAPPAGERLATAKRLPIRQPGH